MELRLGAFEPIKAVVYDFTKSRSGKHAQAFLGAWRGKLVCDDYAGYKALLTKGVVECGCLAHARREFFDLHAHNNSQLAEQALRYFAQLYDIEREVHALDAHARCQIRQA